jgi:hypothetical protein
VTTTQAQTRPSGDTPESSLVYGYQPCLVPRLHLGFEALATYRLALGGVASLDQFRRYAGATRREPFLRDGHRPCAAQPLGDHAATPRPPALAAELLGVAQLEQLEQVGRCSDELGRESAGHGFEPSFQEARHRRRELGPNLRHDQSGSLAP